MDNSTDQATPIPIKTGSEVNSTWTAGIPSASSPSPMSAGSMPEPLPAPPADQIDTAAAAPSGPTETTPPSVSPMAPASASAVQLPTAMRVPPPQPVVPNATSIPPQAPPPVADLALHPPAKPPRHFPWKVVGVSLAVVAILGGAGGYLYWQGIFLGAPRDPKVALAKMATALANVRSVHETGTFSATLRIPQLASVAGSALAPIVSPAATPPASPLVTPSVGATGSPTPSTVSSGPASSSSPTSVATALTPSSNPTITPTPTPSSASAVKLTVPQAATSSTSQPLIIGGSFTLDQASTTNAKLAVQLDLSQLPTSLLPATLPTAVNFESRLVGKTVYLQFPLLSLISSVGSNQWISLPIQTSSADALLTHSIDSQKLVSAITAGQRIGYDQLGPVRTVHYQVSFDTAELLAAVSQANSASLLANNGVTQLNAISADIWLGVHDMLPYKMQLHLGDSSKDMVAIAYTANLTQYNNVAPVAAPDPSSVSSANLGSLDLTNLDSAVQREARDAQRKADLRQIKSALMLYKTDQGVYPSTDGKTVKTSDTRTNLDQLAAKGYLAKLPVDPNDPANWYGYKSDGTTFELWAVLENKQDPDGQQTGAYYLFTLTNDPSAKDVQSQTSSSQTNLPSPSPSVSPSLTPTSVSSTTPVLPSS